VWSSSTAPGRLGGKAQAQAFGVKPVFGLDHLDKPRDRQVLHRQVGAEPRLQKRALLVVGERARLGHAPGGVQHGQHRLGLRCHLGLGGAEIRMVEVRASSESQRSASRPVASDKASAKTARNAIAPR
jgi:hypothetical protein